MKFDSSDLRSSMQRLANAANKAPKDIVEEAARGFVRDVVKITPPGSPGVSGTAAKKQGEAGILKGLGSIMVAADKKAYGPFEDPAAVHKRARNPRTGRVDKRVLRGGARGGAKAQVTASALAAYKKVILAKVGLLASGWNAAAAKLGVRLPAWVSRHGTGRGAVVVKVTPTSFSVTVSNEVKFVEGVKDYERRVKWAIRSQERKIDRRADFLLKKAIREAGFP